MGTSSAEAAPTLAFGMGASFSQALSVGKGPGATALTRMPLGPSSRLQVLVKPITPNLLAA